MKNILPILLLFSTFTAYAQATCANALTDGLLAHYTFSGNAQDISGNNNHGTVSGAILTQDRFNAPNKAYKFNGSSDFIALNKGLQLSQNYTVSAWINTNDLSSNWQTVISKYETNLFGPYWFGVHLDRANAWISNGSGSYTFFDSDKSIPKNQWLHIVWTGRGTIGNIYINGVLSGTRTIPLMTQNNDLVTIGKQVVWAGFDSNCWFSGSLDDIRLYNRDFSACQVLALYERELIATTPTNDLALQDFSIFPNPANNTLTIDLRNTEGSIKATIKDITGRTIIIQQFNNAQQAQIQVNTLENGMYFLEIDTLKDAKTVLKFVKN
jgi:Concanavalin A-like lectin/glucanases superfamily/Secretion system C-terminal sorting domain